MAKREVMTVKTEKLFQKKSDYFKGFVYAPDYGGKEDFMLKILKNYEYLARESVENNPAYKQPIGYSIILNPVLRKVYVFQRAKKDKDYGEKRLQGKWSFGIGGHIDKEDEDSLHPIKASIFRELKEEIGFEYKNMIKSNSLGFINDDSNSIGSVHFGMMYVFETSIKSIKPIDQEICRGKFRSIKEIEKIIKKENVETWTKIAFPAVKKYISYI